MLVLVCVGGTWVERKETDLGYRFIDEILKFFERKLYLPKPLELREREKQE